MTGTINIKDLNGKTIGFSFWDKFLPGLKEQSYTSSCISIRPAKLSVVVHYAEENGEIIKDGFPIFFTVKETLSERIINYLKDKLQ